ncbi:DNA polymerase I-like [Procambarus clarkii]|uniref:DNA polymerase I-like n=1 Tax=Procambarus clarkii TaxID=6728 RepID=UPI00374441A0
MSIKYVLGSKANKSYKIASVLPFIPPALFTSVPDAVKEHCIAVELTDYTTLLDSFSSMKTEYVITTDDKLFKKLTKKTKVSGSIGLPLPCVIKGYEYMTVMYSTPETYMVNLLRLDTVRTNTYVPPSCPVKVTQLHTLDEIRNYLKYRVTRMLSCDIETFSLKHYKAGIASIGFSEDQNTAVSFLVDLREKESEALLIKRWLKQFFERRYQLGINTLYHNAGFDVQIFIYQLWMRGLTDRKGLLEGLNIMTSNYDDTKVLSYLANNSTRKSPLDLKSLAEEYMGRWSKEDIKNIREIPVEELLEYNARDCAATWYVHNKYLPVVMADNQYELYKQFKGYLTDIIQMQLTGLPFIMHRAKRVNKFLKAFSDKAKKVILDSDLIKGTEEVLAQQWAVERNKKLKKKRVKPEEWPETFNLNSSVHLRVMLYEVANLPVLAHTDSGLASTDKDTLKSLMSHTEDESIKAVLKAIQDYTDASKLISTFMPPLLNTPQAEDGWHYLYGNFNIGGTVSGRLSSSGPNLQNLPSSGARFSKVFKYIFKAPPGYLFVGADFASLEDRISALITKDPNKLKVYESFYDGHSLRAYYYFKENMPDINPDSVDSINSISKKYPKWRQASKAPTFLLTYGGSFMGLMNNCGFDKETALAIEANYHEMYKVSDQVIQERLQRASELGYAEVAFGLRVRTPSLTNGRRGPSVEADKRTVGNAMGQSYGLLNNRAVNALMSKAKSIGIPVYPCAQIHDASYYIIRDDLETIDWMNRNLPKEMEWQGLPDITHPTVGLGGELSIFKKSWGKEISLPNNATKDEIQRILDTD